MCTTAMEMRRKKDTGDLDPRANRREIVPYVSCPKNGTASILSITLTKFNK